ncbi:lipopolysaccharide biosynthesis protein [Labrys neptuniae]|uniref:Lipopolysaccharide biosynthesis protein n=1 Tax=Labrys neptuniae TaxID=376174 RepID=A0ABV3PIM3_9HYPH|nr:lipopolysaccharide biosynthesis protein [Labrys neptuniae]MDT3376698.1 lipopolysaccharide biosynthesis protein [Labrys neptuniae]
MRAEIGALSKQTAKAGAWTAGARLAGKSVDFVALIVLARFLGPSDFGLVAMAMTLIFIVEAVMELPLGAAMLRVPEPTAEVYNTAFTLGALRGLIIAGFFILCAWPISFFYGEPRLVPLVMSLALAPAMRGCVSPMLVEFNRRMDFRRQAGLDITSKTIAVTTAIIVAILTRSYWSIALGTILVAFVALVGSYWLAPMRPRLTLKAWPVFADILTWNLMSQILSAINWQADRFILPRFIPPAAFGRYVMANDLSSLPFQVLAAPLGTPLNVAFVNAHQNGGLRNSYLKASVGIFLLMAPILCFGAIMAEHLIHVFLGPQWAEAAPILTGIALACIGSIPALPMAPLAVSLNKSRQITFRNLVEFAVRVPLTIAGILCFGVMGAIAAKALATLAVLVSTMMAVKSMIGLSYRAQLAAFVGPCAALVISALFLVYVSTLFQDSTDIVMNLVRIGAAGAVYLVTYVGSVYLMARWFGDAVGLTGLVDQLMSRARLRFRT